MSKTHSYKLEEVFGVSKNTPLSYVERLGIDDLFADNIKRRKNIVVHGCSKQGKTCLRNKHLAQGSFITVYCQYGHSLKDIYSLILKTAGFEIVSSSVDGSSEKGKIAAGLKVFLGLKISTESETSRSTEKRKLELDISDANDMVTALKSIQFDKYILLEDYHYLNEEVQTAFSQDIKIFEENSSISFIIIGVWLDQNKLLHHNGDLAMRIQNINADIWKDEEMKKVIFLGEELLNIRFPESFANTLIENAGGSIAFVQTVCYEICRDNNIYETTGNTRQLSTNGSFFLYLEKIIEVQNSRFKSLISSITFAGGKKEEVLRVIMVCLVICSLDKLKEGLHITDMMKMITTISKKDYKKSLVEKCLRKLKDIQAGFNFRPLLLDYDESLQQLVITDKLFFLWLATKNWNDLLADMEIDFNTKTRVLLLKY